MQDNTSSAPTQHRSIWLSDIHLGTKGCQAERLLDFLKHNRCDTLYLVGDIIDGWQLKNKVYWPQSHTNIIRKILKRSKQGTKVVFITGNHDEFLRKYAGQMFGEIEICNEYVHTTAAGKRLLLVHGDEFDAVTMCYGWLARLGSKVYDFLIEINALYNKLRARLGYGYWSLSKFLKFKVKSAVNFVSEFEYWVAHTAKTKQFDGVVCGHIHHAEIRDIEGITYHNCGDWVESCTALVEDEYGHIEILNWSSQQLKVDNPVTIEDDDLNLDVQGGIISILDELKPLEAKNG